MIIDCDGCGVRGDACGDCVVAVLLGAPPDLQADEQRALGVLAEAGLVPPLRLVPLAPPVTPGGAAPENPAGSAPGVGDVKKDTPHQKRRAV